MTKIVPISAVNDAASQGKRIYNKMYIIREDEVDYEQFPERDANARTLDSLVFKEGSEGFKEFNLVKYTAGATSEGSSGDITSQVTNTITGTLGGDRDVIDDLLEDHIGEAFFVVVVDRFSGKKYIYGRKYSPMFLSAFSKRKNADNTSCDVTFSNESFFQPLQYLGSLGPDEEEVVEGGEETLGGES